MKNLQKIISIFLFLGVTLAKANSQKIGLIVGIPEGVDLKYEYEWPYLGIGVTPGILMAIALNDKKDHNTLTSWNPSLSIFKTIDITNHLRIAPKITGIYWYGIERSVTGTITENSNATSIRVDKLYAKTGAGFIYFNQGFIMEFNPGLTYYRKQTNIESGNGSLPRGNSGWFYEGIYASLSMGFQFGDH
jgi:hypothetical protein